jgi:hypothetical protein
MKTVIALWILAIVSACAADTIYFSPGIGGNGGSLTNLNYNNITNPPAAGIANTITNSGGSIGTTLLKGDAGQGVATATFADVQALAPGIILTNGHSVAAGVSNTFTFKDAANATVTVSNGTVQSLAQTNTGNIQSATLNTTGNSSVGGNLNVAGNCNFSYKNNSTFCLGSTGQEALANYGAQAVITQKDAASRIPLYVEGRSDGSTNIAEFHHGNGAGTLVGAVSQVGNLTMSGVNIQTNGFTSYTNFLTINSATMPATTVNWTNPVHVSIEIYLDNTAVTGTSISKNGTTIFSGLSSDVSFGLRDGEYFSETYTVGTPALKWGVFP